MIKRRMISLSVIESGRFLKMSLSAQALYMHLVVHADDDGIVEAYSIMNLIKCNPGDLESLIEKGFVTLLRDTDLIAYINDWLEMNTLRADRKVDSKYKELLLKVLPNVKIIESKPRSDRGEKAEKAIKNQQILLSERSENVPENLGTDMGRPMGRLKQQHKTTEYNINNNINMGRPNDVVDLKIKLSKVGIQVNSINFLISRFPVDLIIKQLGNLMQNKKYVKNPAAWLFSACQNNYDLSSLEKTKKVKFTAIEFDTEEEPQKTLNFNNINGTLSGILEDSNANISTGSQKLIDELKRKLNRS